MSVTDMYECTHGPKKDCHACLIPEMAKALEEAIGYLPAGNPAMHHFWLEWLPNACAILERARLIDDCIPYEEAAEAALDHGHPHE